MPLSSMGNIIVPFALFHKHSPDSSLPENSTQSTDIRIGTFKSNNKFRLINWPIL